MTPAASSRFGALLENALAGQVFRVSCDGQSLFVGVRYEWYGQAALATPVMDVLRDTDGSLLLYLGAYEGAWGGLPWLDPAAMVRIDRPELRAAFCRRGALRELDRGALPIGY